VSLFVNIRTMRSAWRMAIDEHANVARQSGWHARQSGWQVFYRSLIEAFGSELTG
jgi:hypothetical protein